MEPVEWQALPALDAETQSDSARDTINPGVQLREPNFRKLSQRLDKYTKGEICGRKVNTATLSLPSLSKISSSIPIVNDKGKKNFSEVHFTEENNFFSSDTSLLGMKSTIELLRELYYLFRVKNREIGKPKKISIAHVKEHKFSFLFVLLFWTLHNRRLYGTLFATALT